MPRDYKPARGKKRRPSRKARDNERSPFQLLLAGFSFGVIAAAIVYYLLTPAPPSRPDAPVPAGDLSSARPEQRELPPRSPERPAEDIPTPAVEPVPDQAASAAAASDAEREPPKERLGFWEFLKNYEVILPEDNEQLEKTTPLEQVQKPGTYLLQVGAFTRFEDADRLKAQLALSGIECRIQQVTLDGRDIYRVRIGPESELAAVNDLRQKLSDQDINVLLIRVSN